ncbi:hypothetical protein DY467_25380 [Rhodopseudomonas sp. BR0G17]|nr:hypothetical protein [Rhodopseudomonas sp. BR0G17]
MANLDLQRARDYQAWKVDATNKGKGFEDFETDWSEKIAKQDAFGDLSREVEKISGAPRTDIGGTLNNPGPAPRQQQPAPSRTRQGVNWSIE